MLKFLNLLCKIIYKTSFLVCTILVNAYGSADLGLYHFNKSDSLFRQPDKSLYHANIALPILKENRLFEKYCYLLNTKSYLFQITEQFDSMESNNLLAYREAEQLLGIKHPEYFKSLNNYARVLQIKGKLFEAKDIYIETLRSASKIQDNNLLTAIYSNLGEIYLELGDIELALIEYQKALEFNNKYLGGNPFFEINKFDPKHFHIVKSIADIFFKKSEISKCADIYTKLENYLSKFAQVDHKVFASFYIGYVELLRINMDYNNSIELLDKALEVSFTLPLENSRAYQKLSELYFIIGFREDAIRCIRQSIKVTPEKLESRISHLRLVYSSYLDHKSETWTKTLATVRRDLNIDEYENSIFKGNSIKSISYDYPIIIDYYKQKLRIDQSYDSKIRLYKLISFAYTRLFSFYYSNKSTVEALPQIKLQIKEALNLIIAEESNSNWLDALFLIELGKSLQLTIENTKVGTKSLNKIHSKIREYHYMLDNLALSESKKNELQTEISSLTDSLLLNDESKHFSRLFWLLNGFSIQSPKLVL